jgi:hypothetical protein
MSAIFKFKYHKQNSIKPTDRLNLDLNKQNETYIQNQESKYLFESCFGCLQL